VLVTYCKTKHNDVHTGPGCNRKPVSEWPDNGTNSFPRIGGFSITDRSELTSTNYVQQFINI